MGDEVISSEDVDKVRGVVAGLGRAWTPMDVAQALTSIGRVASDSTVLTMVEELRRTSSGAGRLEPLLALDGVTDVLVNGPDQVSSIEGEVWSSPTPRSPAPTSCVLWRFGWLPESADVSTMAARGWTPA